MDTHSEEKRNLPERLVLEVALVHDWLTTPTISEEVFREMCYLYPGDIFTSQWDRDRVPFAAQFTVNTSYLQDVPLGLANPGLYEPLMPAIYRGFATDNYDLILSDSHSFAHAVPKRPGALHIHYYHSPARSLWLEDEGVQANPGILTRAVAGRLRRLDVEASRNPDLVIANSQATATRIEKIYHRKVDAVIPPPVDTHLWLDVKRESTELGYLFIGDLANGTGLNLAIEACKQSGDWLQIVGSGPQERELKSQAEDANNIVFHGELSFENLKQVMARCRALIVPAYHDFVSVVVEAMAAGLPVIALASGGASEAVPSHCGVLFENASVEALLKAMDELDHEQCDPVALKRRAQHYDRSLFRQRYQQFVDGAITKQFSNLSNGGRAYAL